MQTIENMKMLFLSMVLLALLSCSKKETYIPTRVGVEEDDASVGKLAAGCPNTQYDDWETSEYVLPFRVGDAYVVNLSHCSGSYHSQGRADQYAIDFEMPIGTSIMASRYGRVVYVEESGRDGGFPNNVIVIRHDDTTFGQYMHLTHQGSFVRVGDTIRQGQEIGLSGSTGLAGYPHLHFVVTDRDYNYPYVSIPTTFKNTVSNERSLAAWTRYKALPY